jgi:small multidrug resistance family-3 protein
VRAALISVTAPALLHERACLLRDTPSIADKSAPSRQADDMLVVKSVLLFLLAAVLEIGGAWLVWQGVRESRGYGWVGAGVVALGAYGFVAAFQPDPHFGRVLAAYGGVFIAGSLIWAMAADGFRPDRWDIAGAVVCLAGVGVIMYAPR